MASESLFAILESQFIIWMSLQQLHIARSITPNFLLKKCRSVGRQKKHILRKLKQCRDGLNSDAIFNSIFHSVNRWSLNKLEVASLGSVKS